MKYVLFPAFAVLLFLSSSCGPEGPTEPEGLTLQDSVQFIDDILKHTPRPFGMGFSMVKAVNEYEAKAMADSLFEDANTIARLAQSIQAFDQSCAEAIASVEAVEEIAPDIGLKARTLDALNAFKDYSDKVCSPTVDAAWGGISLRERATIANARRGMDVRAQLEMFQIAQEEFARSLNMPQDSIGALMFKYQIKPL